MIARAVSSYKNSFTGLSRSIWLLSLVSLVNRSGTMVLPFLTIYLTLQKGFTFGQAGWAMTCFGVGSAAGAYLGGRLTDKFGYYPVQFWSLVLGGAMFPVLSLMDSPAEVWTTIFILAVLGESFRPAAMTAISAYSDASTRTRSFSLFRMSINLGWTVGPAAGGLLAAGIGYEALFWADGLTCIAAALVLRFFLRPSKAARAAEAEEKEAASSSALSPLRDRRFLFFISLTTLGAVVFFQFLSTLPVFYKQELHLSESGIGLLFALNGLLIVLLEMPMVRLLERKFQPLNCIMAGVVLYGVTYLLYNLPGAGVGVAVISMVVMTAGEVFNMPFTNAYVSGRATAANRGSYMGLFAMSYSLALIFSPTLGMQVAESWGFGGLWWLLAGFCAVACAGIAFLKKKEAKEAVVLEEEAVAA